MAEELIFELEPTFEQIVDSVLKMYESGKSSEEIADSVDDYGRKTITPYNRRVLIDHSTEIAEYAKDHTKEQILDYLSEIKKQEVKEFWERETS